jgi:unsaturated chondroitin disaccharide hydrolase
MLGVAAISAMLALAGPAHAASLHAQSIQAMRLAEQRMQATAVGLAPTAYPYYTGASGAWVPTGPGAWTSGFFPGSLWLIDRATHQPVWASEAETWQAGIEGQDTNTGTQDLGFMIFDSFGNGYEQTHAPADKEVVLTAAASLATRYSPVVGAIRSWGSASSKQFTVIVDNLMDLELLLWASKHGGPKADAQIALTDGLTTLRDFVRADGSTIHVVNYDPGTGAIESTSDDGTTWARGQAWAIHGFTTLYAYTHDPRMLSAAEEVANWWVANVPADGVPYSNFEPADPSTESVDSSAAAVAASGLIALAQLVHDPALRSAYLDSARTSLTTITSPAYLSTGTDNAAVLLHGTDNVGAGIVDTGLSYGDYYLLEGLLRLDPALGRQAAKAALK